MVERESFRRWTHNPFTKEVEDKYFMLCSSATFIGKYAFHQLFLHDTNDWSKKEGEGSGSNGETVHGFGDYVV